MEKQTIKLDIVPNKTLPPSLYVKQYDYGSRVFEFKMFDSLCEYAIPANTTVTLEGTKPDGYGLVMECSYSGNIVTCDCTQQMTAVSGIYRAAIRLVLDDGSTESADLFISVQPAAVNEETVVSTSDLNLVHQAVDAAKTVTSQVAKATEMATNAENSANAAAVSETNAKNSATASASSASESKTSAGDSATSADSSRNYSSVSKKWAIGETEDGTPSDTNSSKYYANQSADSATKSANSASASAASQSLAKTSETNADKSATNAASSETKAAASQTAAATSETNAANSEKLARSWAVGGTTSRSGEDTDNAKYYASQSSTSSTSSANSATDSANSAKESSDYATNSANSAKESSIHADGSKASATDSANFAKNAESWAIGGTKTRTGEDSDNAKYYASKAAASQTAAATSETNAKASADKAEEYAVQTGRNVTNTTYTLSQDTNDKHKVILTASDGEEQSVVIPDNNDVYDDTALKQEIAKKANSSDIKKYTLTQDADDGHKLTFSDGTNSQVITIPDENTVYDDTEIKQNYVKKSELGNVKLTDITLLASKWIGDSAPYSYTIDGYDNTFAWLALDVDNATAEQLSAAQYADIISGARSTFYALGDKPTVDIPAIICVLNKGE